jgi:hypothetical protein
MSKTEYGACLKGPWANESARSLRLLILLTGLFVVKCRSSRPARADFLMLTPKVIPTLRGKESRGLVPLQLSGTCTWPVLVFTFSRRRRQCIFLSGSAPRLLLSHCSERSYLDSSAASGCQMRQSCVGCLNMDDARVGPCFGPRHRRPGYLRYPPSAVPICFS